jgi:hypothetical protein
MDVGGWLRSLGLGQYEALFRASEIDADILPELTSEKPRPIPPLAHPPPQSRLMPHNVLDVSA